MIESTAHLRERWRRGEQTVNVWLASPDAAVAEVASRSGFDSLCIDMQHGLADFAAMVSMLRATAAADVPTLVRVPWNEPAALMRALDAGAAGVIVPLVDSAEQAEAAVAACRYAPRGGRSYGPTRAALVDPDYFSRSDETVMVFVMIETVEGLGNLDAIMSTPGLTGVYVGPADLALSMGLPPLTDIDVPEHNQNAQMVLAAARRHGLVAGMHTASVSKARLVASWGYDFVTITSDLISLRADFERRLREFRAS